MLIDLRELLSGSNVEDKTIVKYEAVEFDDGLRKLEVTNSPEFELALKRISKNKISIKGECLVELNIPCDRCLTDVKTAINISIDEVVDFNEDASEDEAKEEKDYIGGYDLDVDKLIAMELIISMPGKTLCSPDCKGLCSVCGNNLNIKECGCNRESLDPRMSVFKDILNNFKEV